MGEKPNKGDIVARIQHYLTGYMGEVVDIDDFSKSADPHVDIAGASELLRYRFLRTGIQPEDELSSREELPELGESSATADRNGIPIGITDFVALLSNRLRSIDAAITQDLQIFTGEIRGRVDWQETNKHRHRTGNPSSQQFACRVPERTILSSRNRVLLQLLATIQDVYQEFDRSIVGRGERPGWFPEWAPDGLSRQRLESALENAHLNQIELDTVSVTDQEVNDVCSDREPLYREAAALLSYYRRLNQDDLSEDQLRELFTMDVFNPDESNEGADIFELYWIFKLIDTFDNTTLQPLESIHDELIASWQTEEAEYRVYNDWNGLVKHADSSTSKKYLDTTPPTRSRINPDSVDGDSPIARPAYIQRHHEEIRRQTFGEGADRKNPDIVILKLDPATDPLTLKRTFIGEVKHSTSKGYLESGVQQLLEYGSYTSEGADLQIGHEGEYLTSDPSPLYSDRLELGLFVGHEDAIDGSGPTGIQICGWDQDPDPPFES